MKCRILITFPLLLIIGIAIYHAKWTPTEDLENTLEIEADRFLSATSDPLLRGLFTKQISGGSELQELLDEFEPVSIRKLGPYELVDFIGPSFTDLRVIAHHGKLVSADFGACVFHKTFFNMISEEHRLHLGHIQFAEKYLMQHENLELGVREIICEKIREDTALLD